MNLKNDSAIAGDFSSVIDTDDDQVDFELSVRLFCMLSTKMFVALNKLRKLSHKKCSM